VGASASAPVDRPAPAAPRRRPLLPHALLRQLGTLAAHDAGDEQTHPKTLSPKP
jgi:hypothetical protein